MAFFPAGNRLHAVNNFVSTTTVLIPNWIENSNPSSLWFLLQLSTGTHELASGSAVLGFHLAIH